MMFTYGDPAARVMLIQMVDDHDLSGMASEVDEIRRLTEADFCLRAIKIDNWNDDLSPWRAPAVFGNADFGGGAAGTLKDALKCCADADKTCIVGGYSLAGLFALWAAYQTDVFAGVAAASPSVWFPGFVEFMKENPIHTRAVCLSLGDREERTRNPVMATVGARIREAHELLKEQGIDAILEWNPGNHFREPDMRTARAFAWVMRHLGRGNRE